MRSIHRSRNLNHGARMDVGSATHDDRAIPRERDANLRRGFVKNHAITTFEEFRRIGVEASRGLKTNNRFDVDARSSGKHCRRGGGGCTHPAGAAINIEPNGERDPEADANYQRPERPWP